MNRKHHVSGIFASLGILILILDGKTALFGARTGIDLCIRTVIPALFPFILLSILLTSALSGTPIPVLRPLARLCGVPKGAEPVLLAGFLGGYPAGAQAVSSFYRSGQIRKEEAERLLSFCNNAGPAFLFGMISPMFPDPKAAFVLWMIHMGSAIMTAVMLPVPVPRPAAPCTPENRTMAQAMRTAVAVMAAVCGWVVGFRVLIAFLDRWFLWMLPPTVRILMVGILELSNGCCELSGVASEQARFLLCSGILAPGGLCVAFQTSSVTEGLSIYAYLKGKALQTLFSLLLSASVILGIWLPVFSLLLFLAMLVQKTQKRSRNPNVAGV